MRLKSALAAVVFLALAVSTLLTLPTGTEAQSGSASPWYRSGSLAVLRAGLTPRLPNNVGLRARNAANTADRTLIVWDNSDDVAIGDGNNTRTLIQSIHVLFTNPVLFANLGTPANGTLLYCSDCTFANPCAGAGTGAFAKRLAGAWRCD
jgi:hypothetical protein